MNIPLPAVISEEDQQSFNNLAADFAVNELADCIHEYEYPFHLDPSATMRKITDLGFFSINLPSDCGGLGLSAEPLAGILEQISLTDAGLAGTLFANAAALEVISAASASSDCAGIYGIIGQDSALPLSFQAYSGPGEASAPAAEKKNGEFFLYGRADLMVAGGTATHAVMPAAHEDGAYSYFLVSLDDTEIKKSAPVITIGMQSCRPVDLELNGARGILIGKEREGKQLFEELCRRMSYPVCGILLGIMKGSFNTALEYCGQRYQGGRMIIQWSDVRKKLGGMASLVNFAESCVFGLKSLCAPGGTKAGPYSIAAAVHIGDISAAVTSEGIQLLGGNGYMKDYGQEKRMRDAKQAQSLLGSSQLRKNRLIDGVIRERQDAGN